MIYTFTEEELFEIWRLARLRHAKERRGVRSRPFSNRKQGLQLHYEGLLAEWAVAKLLGLDVDRRIFLTRGDGGGPDLILPDGRGIQVKFRGNKGWDFALPGTNPDLLNAEIGVLVWPHGDGDDVEIAGWFTRDDFVRHAEIQNYVGKRNGDRLVLKPEYMRPFEDLVKEVRGGVSEALDCHQRKARRWKKHARRRVTGAVRRPHRLLRKAHPRRVACHGSRGRWPQQGSTVDADHRHGCLSGAGGAGLVDPAAREAASRLS